MGPETEAVSHRNRKENDSSTSNTTPPSTTPTSFRLITEGQLARRESGIEEQGKNSTYGVQSLRDTIYDSQPTTPGQQDHTQADNDKESRAGRSRRHSTVSIRKPHILSQQDSEVSQHDLPEISAAASESPSSQPQLRLQTSSVTHSLTSLSLDSQAPLSSLASSPKSRSNRSLRPSDGELDEADSQAVASSSEDEALRVGDLHISAPQLIIPSIRMPSRRPFTDKGKALGRLKVMLAGNSGVGKTSLIRSIVQTCNDIVHVDPLSSIPSVDRLDGQKHKRKRASDHNAQPSVTEIYASSKPYPLWWSTAQEPSILRRRSTGDTVLERNLCFVDTPGYGSGMSKLETINAVTHYVESQLPRSFTPLPGDGDIVGLLSGNGGSQVDLVFYLISQDMTQEDTIYLQRLAAVTNVVIMISKSDNMSPEEIEVLRRAILQQLHAADIKTFQFPSDGAHQGPFTVCSTPSEDDDNMDASLLMSSDYVEPLVPSELGVLIDQILDNDVAACLRHHAARKLVQRPTVLAASSSPSSITRATSNPMTAFSGESPTSSLQAMVTGTSVRISPYLQAQIADHTQHEEQLGRLRLAKWAADLQKSLQDERARYESLAQGERAGWLHERLYELDEKSSVPNSEFPKGPDKRIDSRRTRSMYSHALTNAHDPLGLLRLDELIRERGWLALKVAGSFGILGALAVWCARTWIANSEWTWTWYREE